MFISLTAQSFYDPENFRAHAIIPNFSFGAAGDWDCTSNTSSVVQMVASKNPDIVLGLGDYSYASDENCWFNTSALIDSKMRISIGNHDDSSAKLNQILSHYPLITSNLYYSFDYNGIHFLAMATDVDFSVGSAQYNFVVSDLQSAASNPNIKWIIPFLHRPMVIPATTLAPEPNVLRNIYQPIFETYGVKLVLYGHVHYYLRTYQILYNPSSPTNPTIVSTNPDTYNTASGAIYAAIGTGGSPFTGMKTPPAYVKTEFQEYGYLHIDVLNDASSLSAKFFASDGRILDNFVINKSGGSNSPPIANAGPDQSVLERADVSLSGASSTDPDGNLPLTFLWRQMGGIPVTLSDPTSSQPSIKAPFVDSGSVALTFELVVTDSVGSSSNPNVVRVTVNNDPANPNPYRPDPSFGATGSNYFDTGSNPTLKLPVFSLAAWFRSTGNPTSGDDYIVNKGGSGSETAGQNMNYGLWFDSSFKLTGGFETSSGTNRFVTSTSAVADGKWHYSVLTFDGAMLSLYVDGMADKFLLTSDSPDYSGLQTVRTGANSLSANQFFLGNVDEVRVWNRALPASEIFQQYESAVYDGTGQVLYLPFVAQNTPPIANPQSVPTVQGAAIGITLTASDAENNTLTYSVVAQPASGALSGTAPNLTYTPAAGYSGPDSFTFKANDGTVDSDIATVSITVTPTGGSGYHYDPSLVLGGTNFDDKASTSQLQLTRFTVEAWFKTSNAYTSDGYIVNKGGSGSESPGSNQNYGIWMTSANKIRAGFETAAGKDNFVITASAYNNGLWHLATLTYDGTTQILYIDGVQRASSLTSQLPDNTGTQPLRVGANSLSAKNFFKGNVDEVRVWNTALPPAEVANHYNQGIFDVSTQMHYMGY